MKKFSIWMEERLHELAAPGQQPATGTAPATTNPTTAGAQTIDPNSKQYKDLLAANMAAALKSGKPVSFVKQLADVVTATGAGRKV